MNHHSEVSTPGLQLKQCELSRKLEEMEPQEEISQKETATLEEALHQFPHCVQELKNPKLGT